jgi:hypothetical protein
MTEEANPGLDKENTKVMGETIATEDVALLRK